MSFQEAFGCQKLIKKIFTVWVLDFWYYVGENLKYKRRYNIDEFL